MLVDAILIRNRLVEFGILLPRPSDVAEIAPAERALAQTCTPNQGFDGYGVEALALSLGASAELHIAGGRDISEGVLHG